jgi:hypothetical protein
MIGAFLGVVALICCGLCWSSWETAGEAASAHFLGAANETRSVNGARVGGFVFFAVAVTAGYFMGTLA